MTPQGRANWMNTSQWMKTAFRKCLSKCKKLDLPDSYDMENGDLRIRVWASDSLGVIIVSASSSLSLSVSRKAIFDYLNDKTSRFQWDIFTHSSSVKANVEISYGSYPGNQVSIIQPSSLSDNNSFIIQESCHNDLESLIVYVPVSVRWFKSVTSGEGTNLHVLLVGFIISGNGIVDCHPDMGSSTKSSRMQGASILTIFYQIFSDPITKPKVDTIKAITDIDKSITSTLCKIKSALYEKVLIS